MTLGVIPAKKASRRCPNKNMRILGDKPLVGWTFEAASGSELLDTVVVTSDSVEIRKLAESHGFEAFDEGTPPDTASGATIRAMNEYDAEVVVMLQPTSPFRRPVHIDACIKLADGGLPVISVRDVHGLPYRRHGESAAKQVGADLLATNGAVYVATKEWLERNHGFHGRTVIPYPMDDIASVDIDTEFDWAVAEMVVRNGYHEFAPGPLTWSQGLT